jgi:hypothetical protein
MNRDNYPEYRTIRGEGRQPLPAILRLGPPFDVVGLTIALVAVAVVGAFLLGLTMGQQLATTAIGMEAAEVLR